MSRERLADLPRELGRYLSFLYRSRNKFLGERLRGYGFAGAMYMILLHLSRRPGSSQDEIANHMYIDKCNVARRAKQLEDLGFICRETDRSDRRQNNLYLTDKGKELVPVIESYLEMWGNEVTAGLSEEEKTALIGTLSKMAELPSK